MVAVEAMPHHYGIRNAISREIVTQRVIATIRPQRNRGRMMDTAEFLAEVEARAASRAEIARVLGVAPPRITEMHKGERKLYYDEAVKLARHYGISPASRVSAEKLLPILRVCLPYMPKSPTDADVQRLAEEIEYGLELLRSVSPNQPTQETIDLASRVIADRFRERPA